MKFLIALSIIISSSFSFGQNNTDTIYYKSGMVRAGHIYKESKIAIRYTYLSDNGKVKTSSVRKSFLNKYTIGDKHNSVATDFTSKNQSTTIKEAEKHQNKSSVAPIAFAAVGVGVLATVVVSFYLLLNSIF